jgi:hypothetical protein
MPGDESLITVRVNAGNAVTGIGEIDSQTFRDGGFTDATFRAGNDEDRATIGQGPELP